MTPSSSSLLERWARWDRFPGGLPRPRAEAQELLGHLDSRGLALLRGCRGTGKSTLLKMVAARFAQRSRKRSGIIFLDLEDALWAPGPSVRAVEELLSARPERVELLLLDNLDALVGDPSRHRKTTTRPGTRRGTEDDLSAWLGTRRGTEDDLSAWLRVCRQRKMRVLGSINGSLWAPAPEASAVVNCLPMDYSTWREILTDGEAQSGGAGRLEGYLRAGGLPIGRKLDGRFSALSELFQRILLLDVLMKRKLRDPNILTAVSVELGRRLGEGISASSLKGRICRSLDQARMFLDHLQDSGLFYLLPRLADASRETLQSSRLVMLADTGLAPVLGPARLPALALNAVFLECIRRDLSAWHWSAKGRKGLVVGESLFVDVWWPGPKERVNLGALESALKERPGSKGLLLLPGVEPSRHGAIEQRDLGAWLEKPGFDSAGEKISDITVKKTNAIASHLL